MNSLNDCSVCDDPPTPSNLILLCSSCGLKVHSLCYGVNNFKDIWKCSPCRMDKTKFVSCQLCLQKGGALKQTVCKKWVHVVCALFTDGVTFPDKNRMEPIDISKLTNSKKNKRCTFCYTVQGFCSRCAEPRCKERLHITCAQSQHCLKEINDPMDHSLQFLAYCNQHKPIDDERRLSSCSVKDIVRSKGQEKILRINSAKQNAEWILHKSKHSKCSTSTTKSKYFFELKNIFLKLNFSFEYFNRR